MNKRLLQGPELYTAMEKRAARVEKLLTGDDRADVVTLKYELVEAYYDGAIAALDSHIESLKAPAKKKKVGK